MIGVLTGLTRTLSCVICSRRSVSSGQQIGHVKRPREKQVGGCCRIGIKTNLLECVGIEQNPAKLNDLGRVLGDVDAVLIAGGSDVNDNVAVDAELGALLGRHSGGCLSGGASELLSKKAEMRRGKRARPSRRGDSGPVGEKKKLRVDRRGVAESRGDGQAGKDDTDRRGKDTGGRESRSRMSERINRRRMAVPRSKREESFPQTTQANCGLWGGHKKRQGEEREEGEKKKKVVGSEHKSMNG